MPSFGAEYNTILANLATLYDLRQEKIEVVKINRRIDQVGTLIRHPLVQDSTGIIHSFNTNTGNYMPVSVLPVAELPDLTHYQNGTIVSVAGVLYVKKDGAWEKQGNSVDEEVSIVINKDNYTDTHSLEFSTPVLLAEVELILYHMDEDARNALATLTSSEQQSGRYRKFVINKPSFGTGMSLTDTVLAPLDVPAVGMLESLIPYAELKLDDRGEARVDIDWNAFHNVFSFSEGANCSIKVIARLKVLA